MLKLLLCSAIIAPCLILPFTQSSAESPIVEPEVNSFEVAYVEPELTSLESCENAELDVFFYDNYITTHSAEYVAEGVKLSQDCKNVSYIITPIVSESSRADAEDILHVQADELALILEAHGVTPKIAEADTQTEFDALSANGRTATLKIVFEDGDSA